MAKKSLFSKDEELKRQSRKLGAKKAAITRAKNRKKIENTEYERKRAELEELQKEVNKKMKKLQRLRSSKNVISPALEQLESTGGSIKLKRTLPTIKNEIMRAKTFLQDYTSDVSHAVHFTEEIAVGDDIDRWEIFKRIRSLDPSIEVIKGRFSDLMDVIDDYISKGEYTPEQIVQKAFDDMIRNTEFSNQIEDTLRPFTVPTGSQVSFDKFELDDYS